MGRLGVTTAALDLAPAVLVLPGLLVTVVLYSIAELLHAPRSMAMAADTAPPAQRATYLSWFQYSFAIAVTLTPAVFAFTLSQDARLPWLATSVAAVLACLSVTIADRLLRRRRGQPDDAVIMGAS